MSKKKNTLKDLDEFLKQQASSLVDPTPLRESTPASTASIGDQAPKELSVDKILNDLQVLTDKEGTAFRKKFYDLIIQYLETQRVRSAEDKMLINTALYLKSGDNWKEVIRQYWKEHQ